MIESLADASGSGACEGDVRGCLVYSRSLEIGSPLAIVHSGSGILPGHTCCRGCRDHHRPAASKYVVKKFPLRSTGCHKILVILKSYMCIFYSPVSYISPEVFAARENDGIYISREPYLQEEGLKGMASTAPRPRTDLEQLDKSEWEFQKYGNK